MESLPLEAFDDYMNNFDANEFLRYAHIILRNE